MRSNQRTGLVAYSATFPNDTIVTIAGGIQNDAQATLASTALTAVPQSYTSKGNAIVSIANGDTPLGVITSGFKLGSSSGITSSYSTTVLALSRARMIQLQNDTGQALIVSLDGGSSEFCLLPATTGQLIFNFGSNGFVVTGNVVVKTTGASTTGGAFRISAIS